MRSNVYQRRPRWWSLALASLLTAVLIPALSAHASPPGGWQVRSASGELTAEVVRDPAAGTLRLDIRRDGARVSSSRLGITTDRYDLTRGLRLVEQHRDTVTERYRTAVGKRHRHQDTARQLTLDWENPRGGRLTVQIRAFDDGIGFRYRIPGGGTAAVRSEASSFGFPAATRMWAAEHRSNYENLYGSMAVTEAENVAYQFPALFRLPHGTWALVSESDVDGRYVASHLSPDGSPGRFDVEFGEGEVSTSLPLATPWRLVAVGDLADIVETDLVTDLARDQRFPIPDWVQPGTVAWSWWSDGGSPRDPQRQREYVDHAAEEGWEYVLVDEGWNPEWMPGLVSYARERGVGVLLWAPWDDLDTEQERQTRLSRWQSWGVAGIKVDFMNSDSQARMRWYDQILADTAEHRLAINFHGATIPRGIERTWPHVMTMEGVRGAEDYHLGYLTPENNTVLPFSRNAVGSMDYTPITFSAQRRETSAGHELALGVVYESGWQHPADSVESYDSRGVAEAVLRRLPAAWDETQFVGGRPGESATIARRSGRQWFVGAIRAGERGTIRIPLDFLDQGRRYVADVVGDQGHDELVVRRSTVSAGQTLTVPTARNGGAVVLLCPAAQGGCLDQSLLSRVRVGTEDAYLAPGTSHTVRVTVTNRGTAPMASVAADVSAPDGWRLRPGEAALPASIPPGGSATGSWAVTVPEGAESGSSHKLRADVGYRSGASTLERTAVRTVHITRSAPPRGKVYLSDLTPFSSFNWVGPIERDHNNGGSEAGDGGPISLDGRTFGKGLGGHAHSEQVYLLGGRCDRFRAVAGLDDAAGARGSVVFQVWGDGRLLYDSGTRTAATGADTVDIPVTGVEELRLVMADSGDFVPDDLGDWAAARVSCGG
jgi:hypothetical protein